MAKKDFNSIDLIGSKEKVNATTQSFFSEETLKKAKDVIETKRKYTKFKTKENKTHVITIRLTDKEYNELLEQVEQTESGTISTYINKLLKRGL